MKKIICYGDSNTFGYNPVDASRYDENTRWTCVLQKNLGKEYKVINEGVCDRMGFVDNQKGLLFSAQKHFPQMLSANQDIEILVLALGTNDLQFQYNVNLETFENGLKNLINMAKDKVKEIIIVPPVVLDERVLKGFFNFQFDESSIEKSKQVGKIYSEIANANNCRLFDINEFAKPSDTDGLHYSAESHKIIGDKLAEFIKD